MRRVRISAPIAAMALSVAVLGAQGASAQIKSGASGSSTMAYISGQEVWDTVAYFGKCYAKDNKAKAFELIATDPGSRAEAETYTAMFRKHYQSCLGDVTKLSVPHTMVRGAIAEGLYKQKIAIPASAAQAVYVPGAPIRNLSDAARCYAAGHADQVQRLAATKVGSKEEYDAVNAIMPVFSKCIPEAAAKREYSATLIRFRLVEALLRTTASPATSMEKN